VPDVEAALVKAESLGGTRIMGPTTSATSSSWASFADPEGDVNEVVKRLT
jgi:predicted enzyme related to lactoylglutathione lyase